MWFPDQGDNAVIVDDAAKSDELRSAASKNEKWMEENGVTEVKKVNKLRTERRIVRKADLCGEKASKKAVSHLPFTSDLLTK